MDDWVAAHSTQQLWNSEGTAEGRSASEVNWRSRSGCCLRIGGSIEANPGYQAAVWAIP